MIARFLKIAHLFSIIIFAGIACYLPTAIAALPETTLDPPALEISVSEAPPITESSIPPAPTLGEQTYIDTDLPTVSMLGGTGYIFSTQQNIAEGDRDIWWNSYGIIPGRQGDNMYARMISLGQIGVPTNVDQISIAGMTDAELEPVPGEGIAIEIDRDGVIKYAIIRVVSINDRVLTFDWVYPFAGEVLGAE